MMKHEAEKTRAERRLENNPQLRSAKFRNGQKDISKSFNLDLIRNRFYRLYASTKLPFHSMFLRTQCEAVEVYYAGASFVVEQSALLLRRKMSFGDVGTW